MRILIACERSGIVRDALIAKGHDAVSCDLAPTEKAGPHLQCDVREMLSQQWDGMIAFPDCTNLTVSGLHWNKRRPGRAELTEQGLEFVRLLLNADIDLIGLENPIGCISTRIRRPTQIVQPYQFGEDASKATCLWLTGLPKLQPTQYVEPRLVEYKGKIVKRWANQTDSGQNRLGPSATRAMERARTYQGIANAIANQWFKQS